MPKKSVRATDDIIALRGLVSSVRLFKPTEEKIPRNGWRLKDTDQWLYDTVNDVLAGGGEDAPPYLNDLYVLGFSESAGLIAVDTHEERFGWIGYFWHASVLWDEEFPVVAHGFTEWLDRTLASGPDMRFWEHKDFIDLGPVIPLDSH